MILRIAICWFFIFPLSAYAEMYKWVDENGSIHFSDMPGQNIEHQNQTVRPDNTSDAAIPERDIKADDNNAGRNIPVRGFTSRGLKKIDEEMLKILVETGYKAATFAMTFNGEFVMIRGYGWQDRGLTTPINPFTRMRIASIDKCFGSVAAKTLILEGKLDPDLPVFKFLNVKPYNDKVIDNRVYEITLNHLLEHKLGWDREHDGFSGLVKSQVKKTFETDDPSMEQFNQFMAAQAMQNKPGTKENYSNYGSVLVRRMVEKAAGKPYLDYLKSLCGEIKVHIKESLPEKMRNKDEIWYKPETPPYFDCFAVSAPDLCIFFQHYWVSGEPRRRNGYVFSYHGSLPGTTSVIRQRTDGINYAILFNERGKIDNGEVDKRINAIVDKINRWSVNLISDDYEFKY